MRAQADEQHVMRDLQLREVLTPQQLAEAASHQQQLESLHEQEHQLMQPPGEE